jgi:hypothetical protein
MLSCCDEIMLRDEITGFDGIFLVVESVTPH